MSETASFTQQEYGLFTVSQANVGQGDSDVVLRLYDELDENDQGKLGNAEVDESEVVKFERDAYGVKLQGLIQDTFRGRMSVVQTILGVKVGPMQVGQWTDSIKLKVHLDSVVGETLTYVKNGSEIWYKVALTKSGGGTIEMDNRIGDITYRAP